MELTAPKEELPLSVCSINPGKEKNIINNETSIMDAFKKTDVLMRHNQKFSLKTEAYLLQLAYANNKLLSLSNSRTRLLAHQVESTFRIVNSLNQRFLIADEVGLGKTIEAGLVIKELVFRYGIKRILIVCPASLQLQWQNEMDSKFNEKFTLVDRQLIRKSIKSTPGENINPWDLNDKVICSLDFIKSHSFLQDLRNTEWDAVIIDESHRLRRDSLKSTLTYNVAEILSKTTKSFLLLSATPFRGKVEELYYLIHLLDSNLLGPFQTFFNKYCLKDSDLSSLKDKISSVVIRRTKREVGGFTSRIAKTIRFELYPDERELYDATTQYVIKEFNRALQTENRAVGFVMTVFQKLLDSSTYALESALRKRKEHLSYLLKSGVQNHVIIKTIINNQTDFADDSAEDAEELLKATQKKTEDEFKEEIATIEALISLSESVMKNKKGEKLIEILKRLSRLKKRKILIFTQFRKTQNYLKSILDDFNIELFHGSMDRGQKETAIENFKNSADILISTEAGGEGRNMQFCNILINYDLPWSPLKIEQRIGRIHRFGQPYDVYIYNFSTKDTVAERVLTVLSKKLKLFEESIGTPDVMLGEIEEELNLNSIIMELIAGKKTSKKINEEIDKSVSLAKSSFEKLSNLVVSKRMDFNYDEYYKITLNERKFNNNRIEKLIGALQKTDENIFQYIGKKHPINGLYSIKTSQSINAVNKKYGTFDSHTALENENLEFLAFGNPIIDEIVNYCKSDDFGGSSGFKFIDYKKKFIALIFYYIVTFHSKADTREIIPVCVDPLHYLTESEIAEVEKESIESDPAANKNITNHKEEISYFLENSATFFNRAKIEIIYKAGKKAKEIQGVMNPKFEKEINKITDNYSKKIKELDEQLERQICQMKWFNKDMKSAISRTKNNIQKAKAERDDALLKHQKYKEIDYSITILSAGFIIS